MQFCSNYLYFQLLKPEKLKKGENNDQMIIGPLSQGHVPFKLSVHIVVEVCLKSTRAYHLIQFHVKLRFVRCITQYASFLLIFIGFL